MAPLGSLTRRLLVALGALLVCQASPGLAQGDPPDQEPVTPRRRGFNLFGLGDFAVTGMRSAGNSQWKATASTPSDDNLRFGADLPGRVIGVASSPTTYCCGYFEIQLWMAASRSDWLRNRDIVPSLENVKGGGWSAPLNQSRWAPPEIWAFTGRNGSVGTLFTGVTSTQDGSCRDNSNRPNSRLDPGIPLLAGSDCPPTWPGGVFEGERPVADTTWLRRFNANRAAFTFQDFKIPRSERVQDKLYGSFQTYGASNDYGLERLARFGSVIPSGSGNPAIEGYPLGVEWEFHAWSYAVPTVADAMFYKATIINKSHEVYGVGIDYDSLWLGVQMRPFHTVSAQQPAIYAVPGKGAVFSNQTNTNGQNCYGAVHGSPGQGGYTAGTGIRSCLANNHANRGFRGGAGALVILESPIGDLRNKKFSDRASPFYFPGHPNAGDTLTFNNVNGCGFTCSTNWLTTGVQQTAFGIVTNDERNALAGKTSGDLTELQYFDLFHTPDWPQRWSPATGNVGGFARYVPPGNWDYNKDGVLDTLKVMTCHTQNVGGNQTGSGCAQAFTDTLPGGFPNAFHNNYFAGTGPIKLGAGDSTSYTVALVSSPDSASLEATVNNIISLYQNFWLSPEPPCPVNIVAAVPTGGNRQFDTFLRLYFDQSVNDCEDRFLIEQAKALKASTNPGDVRLRILNPTLVSQIQAIALPRGTPIVDTVPRSTAALASGVCNTVVFPTGVDTTANCIRVRMTATGVVDSLFVFKSCDNGQTYTASTSRVCTPSPVRDVTGQTPRYPWQAYGTIARDASGRFPPTFTDPNVTGGVQYTYIVVGQSSPAQFTVLDSVGGLVVQRPFSIRPLTLNALSANTANRNVSVVYVPASRQAGATDPEIQFLGVTTGQPGVVSDTAGGYVVGGRLARPVSGTTPISGRLTISDSVQIEVFDADTAAAGVTRTVVRVFALADTGFGGTPVGPFRRAIQADSFVVTDPNFVVDRMSRTGTVVTSTTVGPDRAKTTTYSFRNRGPQATVVIDNKPIFVTDTFPTDVTGITPPASLARDDLQGLFVFFDPARQSRAGTPIFLSSWWEQPGIGLLRTNANPTMTWVAGANYDAAGLTRYVVEFGAREFGPDAPFRLNALRPQAVDTAYRASLQARVRVDQTVTTPEAAAALSARLGRTITASDLAALELPFTVTNSRFGSGARVSIAVLKSDHRATALLGSAADTQRVSVPADRWIPGDILYFIETFPTFRSETVSTSPFRERVLVDASGNPQTVNVTRVTWRTQLACSGTVTCNPVAGVGGSSYTGVSPSAKFNVLYSAPIASLTNFTFNLVPARSGEAVTSVAEGDLRGVNVVPNPYVMFSEYEQTLDTKRLLFTGLPPTGTIRIYTASGQFVQQITWQPGDLQRNCTATVNTRTCENTGDLFWNMRTREDLVIGPGFYVFVVNTKVGGKKREKLGKFVVIH